MSGGSLREAKNHEILAEHLFRLLSCICKNSWTDSIDSPLTPSIPLTCLSFIQKNLCIVAKMAIRVFKQANKTKISSMYLVVAGPVSWVNFIGPLKD